MMLDTCKHCGERIYPDDETVSKGLDRYHFECAESLDLDEDEEE